MSEHDWKTKILPSGPIYTPSVVSFCEGCLLVPTMSAIDVHQWSVSNSLDAVSADIRLASDAVVRPRAALAEIRNKG